MAEEPFSDKDLKAALGAHLRSQLKESLRDEEAAMRPRSRRAWLLPAIAAALLLILSLVIWLADPGTAPHGPEGGRALAAEYFQPYPNELFPIEMGETSQDDAVLAMRSYERGDFDAAIGRLRRLEPGAWNLDLQFYEGVALLALHRPEEALSALNGIAANPAARYREASSWYLALAYLELGETGRSLDLLEDIAIQPEHPYREEARELMERLADE